MKRVECLTLVVARSVCSNRSKPKPGTFKRCPINLLVMVIKSPQGEKFCEFAKTHGDKTQVEMPKLWQGEIVRLHNLTYLEENWFYSKKKTDGYRERDEEKRQAFIEQLSTVSGSKIVYVDEGRATKICGIGRIERVSILKHR